MKRTFALALGLLGLAACQPDPGYHRQYGSYPASGYGSYPPSSYGYYPSSSYGGYQQPRQDYQRSRYDEQRGRSYQFCEQGSRSRNCVRAPEVTPPPPGP